MRQLEPAPTRRRPRMPAQERGRLKREEILNAAIQTFARTGYNGSDLGTVAQLAGTNASHVLYYFGSKEDLVWELVETGNLELQVFANELFHGELEDFLGGATEIGRLIESHPVPAQLNAKLLAENLVEGALHEHFRERLRDRRGRLARMIRRAQAAGRVRADVDAKAEAADFYAFLEGMVYHHLLDPQRVSLKGGLSRYASRLWEDIKA